MSPLDVHILHDSSGRILAIAPAGSTSAPAGAVASGGGAALGVTPVPSDGQFALRLTLGDEHTVAGPVALVRDFEVDLSTDQPGLRPRTA